MKMLLYAIMTLSLAGCSANCSAPKSTANEQTAAGAFEEYVGAINEGDVETASQFYDDADGFHWVERGQVQYEKGIDAAKSLQQLADMGGKSEMTVNDVKVAQLTDNSALVSAQFDFAMTGETDDQNFAFDGWMTIGMVKRDGGWKIAGGQTGAGPSSIE